MKSILKSQRDPKAKLENGQDGTTLKKSKPSKSLTRPKGDEKSSVKLKSHKNTKKG